MTHDGSISTYPDETLVCGSAVQAIVDRMQATIDEQAEEIKRLKDNHCKDCCCAQSWAALGISEYTGRSIPEEIARLREQVIKNRDIATDLQYICDDQEKEIKRLEAEKAYWYEISGKQMQTVESQHSQICKQRFALKKLGEKVRAKHRTWRGEQHWHDIDLGRIKGLEDALVEERARGDYFDESQECEGYWWDRKNTSDHTQNNYREMARGRLRAEGVIR